MKKQSLLLFFLLILFAGCQQTRKKGTGKFTEDDYEASGKHTSKSKAVSKATPADNSNDNTADNSALDMYANGRFGFTISYPRKLLKQQPESTNGDGTTFTDKNDSVILTVYGMFNADDQTNTLKKQFAFDIKEFKDSFLGSDSLTYKRLGKDFFILSGRRKGKIFYRKTILKKDTYYTAELDYKIGEKAIYDPLVKPVIASFTILSAP